MISVYQALDLKNEIEKFKYYLIDKYSKSLFKSVILNTLNIELERLYLDEFVYKIEFSDYKDLYFIKVNFKGINDFEISFNKLSNDKIIVDIVNELKDYLYKLFKLNYRMKF